MRNLSWRRLVCLTQDAAIGYKEYIDVTAALLHYAVLALVK